MVVSRAARGLGPDVSGSRAGVLNWGLGEGPPLSFLGWGGQAPRVGRLESWVPGQNLL